MKSKLYIILAVIVISLVGLTLYWFKPQQKSVKISQPIPPISSKDNQPNYIENQTHNLPVTKIEDTKFQMPNAVWTERDLTINGKKIHYIFGQGNPAEVALQKSDYTGEGKWQNYVTIETELALKDFLTNPSLKDLIDNCSKEFDLNEPSLVGFQITDSKQLDINHLLLVDLETGRKQLHEPNIDALAQVMMTITNPLFSDKNQLPIERCLMPNQVAGVLKLRDDIGRVTESYINQDTSFFYDPNNPQNPDYQEIEVLRKQYQNQ